MEQNDRFTKETAATVEWLRTDVSFSQPTDQEIEQALIERTPPEQRQALMEWLGMEVKTTPEIGDGLRQTFIEHLTDERVNAAAVAWLTQCQEILASETLSIWEKASKITAGVPSQNLLDLLKNLENATLAQARELPLSLKIALPATALATPFLGGVGAGIAAFGGAISVPALLIFFLGVSGIASVLEALQDKREDKEALFVQGVLASIATDFALMRMKRAAREAIAKDIAAPCKQSFAKDRSVLQAQLLALSPRDFERHVMGFFKETGMTAWVTPAGADAGIDGVAKDGARLILVQCKRYAPDNPVGRPDIQRFKGVLEENQADLGVFVTTGEFTRHAIQSAEKSDKLILISGNRLIEWHIGGFSLRR